MAIYTSIPDSDLKKLSIGFYIPGIDIRSLDPSLLLGSERIWEQIAGVFLACEQGDLLELRRVLSIMKSSDIYLVWRAVTNLAALAGNLGFVSNVFKPFENDNSGSEYFLATALGLTLNPDAIELLLDLHNVTSDEETRNQIERELSYLLESTDGPIMRGADETKVTEDDETVTIINREKYFSRVKNAQALVQTKLSGSETPILCGEVFDVVKLARRLLERVNAEPQEIGRVHRERLVFEASTGIDCSAFFESPIKLNSLQATAILETFLDSDDVGKYAPGQRYFFGHPIET